MRLHRVTLTIVIVPDFMIVEIRHPSLDWASTSRSSHAHSNRCQILSDYRENDKRSADFVAFFGSHYQSCNENSKTRPLVTLIFAVKRYVSRLGREITQPTILLHKIIQNPHRIAVLIRSEVRNPPDTRHTQHTLTHTHEKSDGKSGELVNGERKTPFKSWEKRTEVWSLEFTALQVMRLQVQREAQCDTAARRSWISTATGGLT